MREHSPKRKTLMMAVGRLHRIWEEYIRAVAREIGIPEAYTRTVMFIERHPGASQKQIAEITGVTAAAVNQTVKELCADGYVRKETDERDKRHSRLYVTEKGEAVAAAVLNAFERADGVLTTLLSEPGETALIETLDRAGETLRKEFDL